MKKNAIAIAAILFVTGCASHQGSYGRYQSGSGEGFSSSTTDTPTVLEHDPGYYEGHSNLAMSGTLDDSKRSRDVDMADRNEARRLNSEMAAAESDLYADQSIHADSSVRGGSNLAHGWDASGNPPEFSTGSMDSRVQADSSIRGGSNEARGKGWSYSDSNTVEPSSGIVDHRAKADSSLRGGSMEARGINKDYNTGNWRSDQGYNYSDQSFRGSMDSSSAYESSGSSPSLQTEIGMETTPGFTLSESDPVKSSQLPDDSSFQEPFRAEIASDESLKARTDIPASPDTYSTSSVGAPGQYQSESASSSSNSSSSDLSSSSELSRNNSDSTILNPDPFNNEVGSPDRVPSELGATSAEPNWRFKLNPAQGSPAPAGQIGFGSSGSATMNDDQLAQRVKRELVKDSSGTFGLMKNEIARNITVTSDHGRITLKGSVPSEQAKGIIGVRAGEIDGVSSVDNQLTVSSDSLPEHRDLSNGSHDLEERHNELQP
jgi:hypothetical protein